MNDDGRAHHNGFVHKRGYRRWWFRMDRFGDEIRSTEPEELTNVEAWANAEPPRPTMELTTLVLRRKVAMLTYSVFPTSPLARCGSGADTGSSAQRRPRYCMDCDKCAAYRDSLPPHQQKYWPCGYCPTGRSWNSAREFCGVSRTWLGDHEVLGRALWTPVEDFHHSQRG